MFNDTGNGYIEIQGLKCYYPSSPPDEEIDGFYLSKAEQKFKRTPLPTEWFDWRVDEAKYQKTEPDYCHSDIEKFKLQEWTRRIKGYWFYNNGVKTYLTGLHYMYCNWWKIDIGYPSYRDSDLKYFYFLQYCIEDPNCLGMIDIARRRSGKTYKAGLFLYEFIARAKNSHGGIQSKTDKDAKQVFAKGVVSPFKHLPDFFRPNFDTSGGNTPKSELRFFNASKRGKSALEFDDDELESYIDYAASGEFAYDGSKLQRYVGDESGKCYLFDTQILMFDGSIKPIQYIQDGDVIMGDDSSPREVYDKRSGIAEMYEIIPNKGESIIVTANHTLTLSVSDRFYMNNIKYVAGNIIEMTPMEFLELPFSIQKKVTIYRKEWELPKKEHLVPSYILGLWLGDGSHSSIEITKPTQEIINAWCNFGESENLKIVKHGDCTYRLSSNKKYGKGYGNHKNHILNEFNRLGIINNKHIPNEYLYDSKQNRLELLAGLLDTDGYLDTRENKSSFEIIQKSKKISDGIIYLCNSLGFRITVKEKIATMKREDGSIYKCLVYRMCIYGDIDTIPTKIPYKKATISRTKNRRNPQKTGFKIKPYGVAEFHGFSVKGVNRLFLLGNGIVAHNCLLVDVDKRHQVTKFCSMEGSDIIGKMLYTTTVEEMENGGAEFKALWDKSDQSKKNDNGRTITGLYRFITLSQDSMYFDDYGNADVDKANKWIESEIKGMGSDKNEIASFKRKYPRDVKEAFYIDAKDCVFSSAILNERLTYLETRHTTTPGDFEWKNGVVDSEVIWVPDENSKKWQVCSLPNFEEQNCISTKYDITYGRNLFVPMNDHRFRIAIDPIDHAQSTKTSKGGSAAAIYVFRQFDPTIDDPNAVDHEGKPLMIEDGFGNIKSSWRTYNFWAQYIYRPEEPQEFYEDVIKVMRFFGCKVLIETQKPGLINHLKSRGYSGFLMSRPEETYTESNGKWGVDQNKEGIPASKIMISHYTGLMKSFIVFHGHRINFKELIVQSLGFTPDKPTEFDAVVAAGNCLIASDAKVVAPKYEVKVENYFKRYKNGKRM